MLLIRVARRDRGARGTVRPRAFLPLAMLLAVSVIAGVAGGADTPARGRSNLLPDPDAPGRSIGDPEDFIFRLRSEEELTPAERTYVELFHVQRGWNRLQVADHLEELLGKTRFGDYARKEREERARRWTRIVARRDVRLGTFVVLLVLGVGIILTDLLRQRVGRWLFERRQLANAEPISAQSLLAEAGRTDAGRRQRVEAEDAGQAGRESSASDDTGSPRIK